MRHKLLIYVICCALALAIGSLIYLGKSERSKLKIASSPGESVKENEVWQSRSEPFMTIPYSKCWEMIPTEEYQQFSMQGLWVKPSNECKNINKDKWDIIYTRKDMTTFRKNPHELPPPPKALPLVKELLLDGQLVHFYGDGHGNWDVNFKCGGVYFDPEKYGFHFRRQETHDELSEIEVPEVFKNFIASIKCDSE